MTTAAAYEPLVREFEPLARAIAYRAARHTGHGVDTGEFVGAAYEGLVVAAKRFDANRGVPFRAYAKHRIQGAVFDAKRSADWVPRTVRERANHLERTRQQLTARLGRSPTLGEVAEALETTVQEVQATERRSEIRLVLSLDSRDDGGISIADAVPAPSPHVDPAVASELREALAHAIASLPEREQLAIVLFYFEETPLKEIGARLEVSESRVSQLCSQGVKRLRSSLTAHAHDA